MKRRLQVILLTMIFALCTITGCGTGSTDETDANSDTQAEDTGSEAESETASEEQVTIRVGGLSGPTSMGLMKLMEDAENGETENTYEFAELSSDSSAFVTPLATGEIDIAAVPSNLASVIYNNTDGGVQVLAVNVLGVLSIVQRGEQITELADLTGKTVYATGQGATPEYTLRYLLTQNGIDPDNDLTIQWCSDTTEALSYIVADEHAIAMLPQPFVTAAQAQVEDLTVAIDLNDEWAKLGLDCEIVTGVLVVRTEFAEEYPEQLAVFMEEYEASVQYTQDEPEAAAALIEKYIGLGEAVALAALPSCHLTCLTGDEMRTALEGYLQIIYDMNEASVGGAMPGDDFYYR